MTLPTPIIAAAVILLSHQSPTAKALEAVAAATMPCPAPEATMQAWSPVKPKHEMTQPPHHRHHHHRHHHEK